MDINKKVLLLALAKKKEDESFKDILLMLENSHLFTLKEGKRLLKELKQEQYVNDESLTFKGFALAKDIEEKFKL
ncbi:hypothetical protein NitYY0826_C0519 [Nitratiruptor sp. YY08-26]|uniref:hypothetical protein n=1 Tax=unclassified Nitratiruptor TaxID=2624044 RepID=UPI001915386F|nr:MULTISPECIES: hypothetical protein [unclassified Nitratiruptor]BCD61658.1 hypothetical protein NitYY0813_C0517 [Nitratiruptor sp. YY08-13]BCD65593.1 hypothetical protein NitYY0826_C0519 [Nitratiruptor sp. YY08-26]